MAHHDLKLDMGEPIDGAPAADSAVATGNLAQLFEGIVQRITTDDGRGQAARAQALDRHGAPGEMGRGLRADDLRSGNALVSMNGALAELSARLAQGDIMESQGKAAALYSNERAQPEPRDGWSASGDPGAGGPMALKSGIEGGAGAMASPSATIRGQSRNAIAEESTDEREPWDAEAAEALTKVYEAETGCGAVVAMPTGGPKPPYPCSGQVTAPSAMGASAAAHDVDWFEDRFAGIALKVEHSLAELHPDKSMAKLNGRLDDLETHLSAVLHEVATRSDLEALRLIEEHVESLARHAELANTQFSRLDEIEQQLTTVVHRLAGLESGQTAGDAAKLDADLAQLIDAAADRAVERLASAPDPESLTRRLDDLRGLVVAFMDEKRRGDEETTVALETMQEAMIRVLDKVEALDGGPVASPAANAAYIAAYEVPPALPSARAFEPLQGATDACAPQADGDAASAVSSEPFEDFAAPSSLPVSPEDEAFSGYGEEDAETTAEDARVHATPASRTVDRMRQDLIAEARRAKLRADAEAAAEAAKAGVAKKTDRRKPFVAGKSASGIKPSRRLMIAAILLLLTVPVILVAAPRIMKKPAQPAAATDVIAPNAIEQAPGSAREGEAAPDRSGRRSDAAPPTEVERSGTMIDLPKTAPGLMFANADKVLSEEQIRRAYEQQSLAERSSRLATSATNVSPAALFREAPPSAVGAGPAQGHSSGTLDLPPPSVGPLSLRMAAANGDPSAQFEVGARLAEGNGTDQSFIEAGRWYQRSAAQGFAQSQYRLATLYERGLGFKTDLARAQTWYLRAAENGNVKAMHNLAVLSAGRAGEAPDYATASQWFERAAQFGLPDSQYNLAVLFENGLGVAKDQKRAYKWYALAARAGDRDATRRRDAMRAGLSLADVAEIDRDVADWRPSSPNQLANDPVAAGEDWKRRASAAGNG